MDKFTYKEMIDMNINRKIDWYKYKRIDVYKYKYMNKYIYVGGKVVNFLVGVEDVISAHFENFYFVDKSVEKGRN